MIVISWVLGALVVALIAGSRGRRRWAWLLISLVISPVMAALLVLGLPQVYRVGGTRMTERELREASLAWWSRREQCERTTSPPTTS